MELDRETALVLLRDVLAYRVMLEQEYGSGNTVEWVIENDMPPWWLFIREHSNIDIKEILINDGAS